jgi:hypothetical protein
MNEQIIYALLDRDALLDRINSYADTSTGKIIYVPEDLYWAMWMEWIEPSVKVGSVQLKFKNRVVKIETDRK